MTDGSGRARLAKRYAELVRALLTDGPIPAGFDESRVRIEAKALLAKRRRMMELMRPHLADLYGDRFAPFFDEWAATNPRRTGYSPDDDLRDFTLWLEIRRRSAT